MSDITTCPKCKADLNVSNAPGESFVCSCCGYTATKSMTLPPPDRDLDVSRSGWRPAHKVLLFLVGIILLPIILFLVAHCALTLDYMARRGR
jgi:hypothetical protein